MKNLTHPIWMLLLVALCWAGCQYAEGLQMKEVPGEFSIGVMDYMSPSDKLHPDARFQYESQFRTVYLLVLRDDKAQYADLAAYTEFAAKDISQSLEDVEVLNIDSVSSIEGLPAMERHITGNITKERVFYQLMTVDNGAYFYRILGWTLQRRKNDYAPNINEMVHSFKPLTD